MSTANQMIWRMLYRRCCLVAVLVVAVVSGGDRALAQDLEDPLRDAGQAAIIAAQREASGNNLQRIMIAMHTYHDALKSFPAAFSTQEGKPLLSWRVALLPYLEDGAAHLYEKFRLDEPWDSEHNRALVEQMPDVYQSPASKLSDGRTVYLTPRAEFTAFPGENPVKIRNITDGLSKTIAVVEVDDEQAVPWTKPDDWNLDPNDPKARFRGQFEQGANTAWCDGSVHFISYAVDGDLFKALLTISGGELINLPD